MASGMYRLVYYSRNHIAHDEAVFASNVDEILAKSRVNNERNEITGALLFNAGCFAQVLEGPLDRVEAAFERIQQDE
ncbi:BLUF domain-containing protein [Neorhizobium sp. DAR64861/K0K2]